jgi:hypothetical protein
MFATLRDGSVFQISDGIKWESKNSAIASVDESGIMTTLAPGDVEVTAIYKTFRLKLVVYIHTTKLTSLKIFPSQITAPIAIPNPVRVFGVYEVATDSSNVFYIDVTALVPWRLESLQASRIDRTDAATAVTITEKLAGRQLEIEASLEGVKASAKLTSIDDDLDSIQIQSAAGLTKIGTISQLRAIGTYAEGHVHDLTRFVRWSSDHPSKALVDNGVQPGSILGLEAGAARISARLGSVVGSIDIGFIDNQSILTLSPAQLQIEPGQSASLIAFYRASDDINIPSDPTTWLSSDESVASVNSDGTVTGANPGSAIIFGEGLGLRGQAQIRVAEISDGLSISMTPQSGTYGQSTAVVLATSSPAEIRYTTDGSIPNDQSLLYTGPINVGQNTVIKAIAFSGGSMSRLQEGQYRIRLPAPTISLQASGGGTVVITSAIADVMFQFSLNGSDPGSNGTVYSGPIPIGGWQQIKALARKTGFEDSAVATFDLPQVSPPQLSLAAGSYPNEQTLTISTSTPGAAVYYTTDDTIPSTTSTLYTSPLQITQNTSYKVVAVVNGVRSAVVSRRYELVTAAPTSDVPSGMYSTPQLVTLSTSTPGARIYYSLNDADPVTNGSEYASPLTINSSLTVKAATIRAGWTPSVATFRYSFDGSIQPPSFSPSAGTYASAQSVRITSDTPGAMIYFTTDGSEPTTNSPLALAPIEVAVNTRIRAIAAVSGVNVSGSREAIYQINVSQPLASLAPGSYSGPQTVALSSATTGAEIRYTLDGSLPTAGSQRYDGPITISRSTTLKAIGIKSQMLESAALTANYSIIGTVEPPTFALLPGTYTGDQTVAISTVTPNATIHFTTDGSTPSSSSPLYQSPISVAANTTIWAIAISNEFSGSSASVGAYTIKVARPSTSIDSGVYAAPQTIKLSSSTAGAAIHYTTDLSEPTLQSTRYENPFVVASTTFIKARAFKNGLAESDLLFADYVITGKLPQPSFSLASGTYDGEQLLAIHRPQSQSVIRFTTDGSSPTAASAVYSAPIPIAQNTIVRAMVFADGWIPSDAATVDIKIRAAAPTTSIPSGVYTSAQEVVLQSTTTGASIHGTLDGSQPTLTSPLLTNLIISRDTVIKAIAAKEGMQPSPITSVTYTITGKVSAPVISPAAGTYGQQQSISIGTSTPGATVRYTLSAFNESNPVSEASPEYVGPITISRNTVVRAAAFRAGWDPSSESQAAYGVRSATPTASPAAGTFTSAQQITLSSNLPNAMIRYTVDNSDPTATSPQYLSSILVDKTMTIKAIAFADGFEPSQLLSQSYVITGTLGPPTFSPPSGTFGTVQSVAINKPRNDLAGLEIHYTTDGTTPTRSSAKYSGPILVSDNRIIQAIAVAPNWSDSGVASGSFNIRAAKPVAVVPGGTYTQEQKVTLSSTTVGAEIRYTLDNSIPTISSLKYEGLAIAVKSSTTLNAIAFKAGMTASEMLSQEYIITGQVASPTFATASGTYNASQIISLSTTTPQSSIYYTITPASSTAINNPAPGQAGTALYLGPFIVAEDSVARAIAIRSDWADSSVAVATYNIRVAAPATSISPGTYTASQQVALSTTTSGAVIRYTTNGLDPTATSAQYTAPIVVSGPQTTIKAIAIKSGMTTSVVSSFSYSITGTVATPVMTPAGSTFDGAVSISISTSTPGAIVRYSIGPNSDPLLSTTVYSSPITVAQNTTIKAIATLANWANSTVAVGTYNVRAATPTASVAGGTFQTAQSVLLATTTAGGIIRYTLNGDSPTAASTEFLKPIELVNGTTTTIKAATFKDGMTTSNVFSATYVITGTLNAPTITNIAAAGSPPSIQITAQQGATIRYTIDGTAPIATSNQYSVPLTNFTGDVTVKAIAMQSGWNPSPISSLNVAVQAKAPSGSPAAGTYTAAQTITLTTTTSGSTIHYTTNNTTPTTASPVYTGHFVVAGSTTVRAIAVKAGLINSPVTILTYTITPRTETVVFAPAAGTYTNSTDVTLSSATPSAIIRYTLDGTTPGSLSSIYSAPLKISNNTTIKAYATRTGYLDSAVTSATYNIRVATPTPSLAAGTYNGTQTVTLTSATDGTVIFYTTNSTIPTTASTPYTGPITINATQTIQAIAIKAGMSDSLVMTAKYTIASHVAFTTSTAYANAGFGGLSAMDTICTNLAAASGRSGTWKAIASDIRSHARDRLLINGSIARMDGVIIATGKLDLWDGALLAQIKLDEKGVVVGAETIVATGTNKDGTSAQGLWGNMHCNSWSITTTSGAMSTGYALDLSATQPSYAWIVSGQLTDGIATKFGGNSCAQTQVDGRNRIRLYCISQ